MGATSDVVVVGAGPAGSVFAARMAQLGHAVTLVEGAAFPRARLGESLTPGVMPMLASMGAGRAIEAAGFPRVRVVATNWEGARTERVDPREEGRLVDRGVFDAILLDHAKEAGVRVMQPAFVRRARAVEGGWSLELDRGGEELELRAAFLADASGRASRLGARRRPSGASTVAIHGYFRGAALPRRPRIEALDDGWCWGVPIPDGTFNALVFVDAARVRTERSGASRARRSLDELLGALLAGSALAQDLAGAEPCGPARAADATPYFDERCVDARRIRVGDAALALDPLSSSGVQRAIQTALSGAIVANTLLRKPDGRDAAMQFHRDAVLGAAARHRTWTAAHYASGASLARGGAFWRARASAPEDAALVITPPSVELPDVDAKLQLSVDARWVDAPCLGGTFVEVQRALEHPRLDGPVAYLGGHALAPLLATLADTPGRSARELARSWSGALSLDRSVTILRWLAARGVLEPAAAGADPERWYRDRDAARGGLRE